MSAKRISIQDITHHAKVSAGMVNWGLHNRGKSIEYKKKKNENAIKELNFNLNLLAQTLAMQGQFSAYRLFSKSLLENKNRYLFKQHLEQAIEELNNFGFFQYVPLSEMGCVDLLM